MDKQKQIVEMFNEIAPTYDKANAVLSFGIDERWRVSAVKHVLDKFTSESDKSQICVADIACGTGDMVGVWRVSAEKHGLKVGRILGIDPSVEMLKVARTKFADVEFLEGFADDTGQATGEFDFVSISYGIRNVVALDAALAEFFRILKSGGRLVVLEFTKRKKGGVVAFCRDFYLRKMLPLIGGFLSRNRAAYEYLPSSIETFLDTESFCERLKAAGFEVEEAKGFSFDVSTMFVAKKP